MACPYQAAGGPSAPKGLEWLFTEDATYLYSHYEQPITGLRAIKVI
jgi:hypothetical protein